MPISNVTASTSAGPSLADLKNKYSPLVRAALTSLYDRFRDFEKLGGRSPFDTYPALPAGEVLAATYALPGVELHISKRGIVWAAENQAWTPLGRVTDDALMLAYREMSRDAL